MTLILDRREYKIERLLILDRREYKIERLPCLSLLIIVHLIVTPIVPSFKIPISYLHHCWARSRECMASCIARGGSRVEALQHHRGTCEPSPPASWSWLAPLHGSPACWRWEPGGYLRHLHKLDRISSAEVLHGPLPTKAGLHQQRGAAVFAKSGGSVVDAREWVSEQLSMRGWLYARWETETPLMFLFFTNWNDNGACKQHHII